MGSRFFLRELNLSSLKTHRNIHEEYIQYPGFEELFWFPGLEFVSESSLRRGFKTSVRGWSRLAKCNITHGLRLEASGYWDNWGMFNSARLCMYFLSGYQVIISCSLNKLTIKCRVFVPHTHPTFEKLCKPRSWALVRLETSAGGRPGWLTWVCPRPRVPSRASVASVSGSGGNDRVTWQIKNAENIKKSISWHLVSINSYPFL